MDVAPGVDEALKNFVLPETLGFGAVNAPVMFSAEWCDQQWSRGQLLPYGPIEILPGAHALQYAELVFEGLKAYRVGQTRPNLFRPEENFRRLERSAQRLSMPVVPLDTAILPGVTRDSLLKLARHVGYTVHERRMAVDELLTQIGSGRCSEIFACGTAAIVMPICALADTDNRMFRPRETNIIASRLRDALLAIQERRAPDPFGWIRVLP